MCNWISRRLRVFPMLLSTKFLRDENLRRICLKIAVEWNLHFWKNVIVASELHSSEIRTKSASKLSYSAVYTKVDLSVTKSLNAINPIWQRRTGSGGTDRPTFGVRQQQLGREERRRWRQVRGTTRPPESGRAGWPEKRQRRRVPRARNRRNCRPDGPSGWWRCREPERGSKPVLRAERKRGRRTGTSGRPTSNKIEINSKFKTQLKFNLRISWWIIRLRCWNTRKAQSKTGWWIGATAESYIVATASGFGWNHCKVLWSVSGVVLAD